MVDSTLALSEAILLIDYKVKINKFLGKSSIQYAPQQSLYEDSAIPI